MSEQIGPAHPDEVLAAAERYAKAGLKIYPVYIPGLKPDGKKDVRPAVKSWSAEATDDLEQVRAWWGDQHRGAGIAVDCGASGIAVADGDMHDGGVPRLREFLGSEMGHPSNTASGGVHVWYRDAEGRVGSGSNILGTKEDPSGVDARGVGGTIFMPPTFVPGYGQYRWTAGEPDWSNLPEAPTRLAEACPPGGRKGKKANAEPVHGVHGDARSAGQGQSQLFAKTQLMHRDRAMSIEDAKARLMPLWEAVRDTKVPNGLWQAVADFARAAAHYQCFWDSAAVGRMVLVAYAEGGHGYTELDNGDLRAIESAYALQAEARASGDLDEGWEAIPPGDPFTAESPAEPDEDALVEALIAEMLDPEQIEQLPPPVPLIDGVLNMDSEAWMIGPPGSKKSFVALDMAGHISTGRPWQGRDTRQGLVVMIVAEGSAGIGKRMKAWRKKYGAPGPIKILPRPVQAKDVGAWRVLVKACARLGPAMVVVDTQHRVTVGLEENSATDMGYYIAAVSALRIATGACIFTLHHSGKSGTDARGTSAVNGAQDTELRLSPDRGDKLRATLKISKQKDLEEGEPINLAFEVEQVGVDAKGRPVTSLVVLPADAWQAASGHGVIVPREDWELHWQGVQTQIIRVLADQGGSIGLTKADARANVAARWYGGKVTRSKDRDPEALHSSTFDTAWTRVLMAANGTGDPIVTSAGGQRYALDPVAAKGFAPESLEPDNR